MNKEAKISFKNFKNFFELVFMQVFRNARSYIFCLFMPLLFSFFLEYSWNSYFDLGYITPPLLISYITMGYIFIGFYLSLNIFELRNNNFFSRIKVIGISKASIIVSYYLIGLIFSFFSFFLNLGITYLYDFICRYKLATSSFMTLGNLSPFIWYELFLSFLLLNAVSVLSFISISLLIKKKIYTYIILISILVYSLVFSEIVICPYIIADNKWLLGFSYLSIFKYCSWIQFIFSSYMNYDYLGYSQIFMKEYYTLSPSFSSVMIPLSICIIFVISLFILLNWKMKFSSKY